MDRHLVRLDPAVNNRFTTNPQHKLVAFFVEPLTNVMMYETGQQASNQLTYYFSDLNVIRITGRNVP